MNSATVAAITHDEAAGQVAAGRLLNAKAGWTSQVCMAHQMQTVIRHALEEPAMQKMLAHCRKLVGHFKHSNLATAALEDSQKKLKLDRLPLRVVQDVCTRWNSTYYMLKRLQELRMALTVVLSDDEALQADNDRLLKDNEWLLMADMVNVLSEFEKATTVVSGQRYVTLSLILPIATHLSGTMAAVSSTTQTSSGKKLAKTLQKELQKKFPIQPYDPTSAAAICMALDLRFRDFDVPRANRQGCLSFVTQFS